LGALVSGHSQAKNVYRTQPAKLAAFEGHFHTGTDGAPLHLFGWPDEEAQTVRGSVAIPNGLSLLLFNDAHKPVMGLDRVPRDEWPPVLVSFQSYHIMVGLGMCFIVLTLVALLKLWRGTLFDSRGLLWVFVFAVIGPYIANQLGWVAAEVGRQPWIVYGLLKTSHAASPAVGAVEVLGSIVMFSLIYATLFGIWLYLLDAKIKAGPEPAGAEGPSGKHGFLDTAATFAGHQDASMTDMARRATGDADRQE
jgi:cytochrome d ubiquinol oxidase subunit I